MAVIDGVVYELAVVYKVPPVDAEYHLMTSLVPGVAESVTTPELHLAAGVTVGATGKAFTVAKTATLEEATHLVTVLESST